MMRHLSVKDLTGDQQKRWAEKVRLTYRKVLRNPGSSERQKAEARRKLAMASAVSR